jgi:hypothetical protein
LIFAEGLDHFPDSIMTIAQTSQNWGQGLSGTPIYQSDRVLEKGFTDIVM